MKRFSFKLEKVLELRRYEERKWELKLGEVTGRCTAINHRIRECAEERARAFSGRSLAGGAGMADFRIADTYAVRLEQEKQRLSGELEECEREREEIRKKFVEASRKRKIIEKLRERQEQQYYHEQRKAEQKEIDDIAAIRYIESIERAG